VAVVDKMIIAEEKKNVHSTILKYNPPGGEANMARKLKNKAFLTLQLVIESPDEVVMVREANLVEFPQQTATAVLPLVEELKDIIEGDFIDFCNYANSSIGEWVKEGNAE